MNRKTVFSASRIAETMMCARSARITGSCQGDSGGPLNCLTTSGFNFFLKIKNNQVLLDMG